MKIFKLLKKYRKHLTKHQYKTLVGQAVAGDETGALKGLNKLIRRSEIEQINKVTT